MSPTSKLDGCPAVRKSPLRLAASPLPVVAPHRLEVPGPASWQVHSPQDMRRMMISEFAGWLRARTNKHNRPFQQDTISAYCDAAVALDAWMTRAGLEGDFTGCDTATHPDATRSPHVVPFTGAGGTDTGNCPDAC